MVSMPDRLDRLAVQDDLAVCRTAKNFGELLAATCVTGAGGDRCALEQGMAMLSDWLRVIRESARFLFLVGNGGSAAVASHAVTDFVNNGKLRATTLHDPSLLTCMTNDYGYESAFARVVEQMLGPGDLLVAISSSGQSMNILNAADQAKRNGGRVVTLTGFLSDNPLRQMGDLNFWLESADYGMVEIGHQFLLHNVSDRVRNALQG